MNLHDPTDTPDARSAPCAACGQSVACPEHDGLILDGRPLCGGCLGWADVTACARERCRWTLDYSTAVDIVAAVEADNVDGIRSLAAQMRDDLATVDHVRTYFTATHNSVLIKTPCHLCGNLLEPDLLVIECGPLREDDNLIRLVCDDCAGEFAPRLLDAVTRTLEPLAHAAGKIDEDFWEAHMSPPLTALDVERLADALAQLNNDAGSHLAVVQR